MGTIELWIAAGLFLIISVLTAYALILVNRIIKICNHIITILKPYQQEHP
jgi:hypothetical protein